jgi:hypothetical protein
LARVGFEPALLRERERERMPKYPEGVADLFLLSLQTLICVPLLTGLANHLLTPISAVTKSLPLLHFSLYIAVPWSKTFIEKFLHQKRSLVRLALDDENLCFARAMFVGMVVLCNDKRQDLRTRRSLPLQKSSARLMMARAGVRNATLCGFEQWELVQKLLGPKCSLVVVA